MSKVKTAISLDADLFKAVEQAAKEMNVSRSRIFAMAVKAFLEHKRNQALLEALNQAYAEAWTEDEERQFQALKRRQGEVLDPW